MDNNFKFPLAFASKRKKLEAFDGLPKFGGERNGRLNFFSPYFFPYFSPSSLIFSAVSPFSLIFHLLPDKSFKRLILFAT